MTAAYTSLSVLFGPQNVAWRRSRNRTVRLNGQRVRVIGSIGASETILNVTDVKCSAGDVAAFDLDPLYARGMPIEFR